MSQPAGMAGSQINNACDSKTGGSPGGVQVEASSLRPQNGWGRDDGCGRTGGSRTRRWTADFASPAWSAPAARLDLSQGGKAASE